MSAPIKPLNALALPVERVSTPSQALSVDDFLARYDTCFPQVYNYIRYRCGDAAIADDLTSAVFERALQCLGDYRIERGPLNAWLLVIARSLVSNHFRGERRRACTSLESWHEQPASEATPEEAVLWQETQQALFAALETLDERERDLLGLKFGAHFSNRRIAEITGLSEANVGIIVHRALNKLRVILKNGVL
jgi:RNA polymerase sigma-70 factor (ECF subfamily)